MSGDHTPGPWIVGQPGGPAGPFYSLINQQGNVVALQIVGEADARLCSAAPDLLAACERALEEDGRAGGGYLGLARRKIERALAKAHGEPEPAWAYPDEAVPD